MPVTSSDSTKDVLEAETTFNYSDSPRDWHPFTMKSNSSQKSQNNLETASVLSKSSASTESPSVELAAEAKEKEPSSTSSTKKSSSTTSWMKNLGNGMRTLRLRKSSDKSSSSSTISGSATVGKGFKLRILDDDKSNKSISRSNSKEDEDHSNNSSSGPMISSTPTSAGAAASHNSHSSKKHLSIQAPPNVVPPFEDDPTSSISASTSNIISSKDSKRNSDGGTGITRRGHVKKWRKSGNSSSGTVVNGNSIAATGNGSVPGTSSSAATSHHHGKSSATSASGGTGGDAENLHKADPTRFIGEGLSYKAKLIGVLEVSGPRGDRICQEALSELKMAVKAAGEHKQKVTVHVALDGLRIRDERTGDCLYHHQVHKISFIAQDLTDSRAFGYIFGSPTRDPLQADTGHRFFGIKTEKSASQVVMAMRDLFQVVFDLKKKEIERAKQQLEMQQKFLATRAAESAPRTENKAGRIAETYIEGACALNPASSRTPAAAPAEADLLNLEVELSNLQEGLENIHSNLMESRNNQNVPFNRGSTTSISSDPMNPKNSASFKYSATLGSAAHTNRPATTRSTSSAGGITDPFGDSFDPFDGGSKFSDPFSNVDPFPLPKPGLETSGDSFGPDPFNSPPAAEPFTFSFNDGHSSKLNRISHSSQSSSRYNKLYEGLNGPKLETITQDSSTNPTSSHICWTASFEDDFAPDVPQTSLDANGSANGSGLSLDIFTELDPLGSGKAKPFIDKKDFFQELKNPPKKNLKDLCSTSNTIPTSIETNIQSNTAPLTSMTSMTNKNFSSPHSLKTDVNAIPSSFSTNFNPPSQNNSSVDFDSHFKVRNGKNELKTTSIRARLPLLSDLGGSDSPPNYSPPPPPPTSQISNSIYFISPAPVQVQPPPSKLAGTSRNGAANNIKKSPQLLKRMTISSSSAGSSATSPRPTSGGSGRQLTLDSSSTDEIPNLTPPPRPPHTGTITRSSATIATAVPRPHSGKSDSRQASLQMAPEPPPRPLQTTIGNLSSAASLPLVSPPPLPPKKQPAALIMSSTNSSKALLNSAQGKHNVSSRVSDGSLGSNDLPLPLPSRKNENNSISIPRYAVPPSFDSDKLSNRNPISSNSPHMLRKQMEVNAISQSTTALASTTVNITMEQALKQVATLSLGQLAFKLDLPVEQLSSLTIQQLAERLTSMGLKDDATPSRKASTTSSCFETNFDPDADASIVSAPSTMEGAAIRDQRKATTESNYDRYAVFRELTIEDASGFSLCGLEKEGSGSGSRTLTSRDSSSERTLQADDEPDNPMSTMDDITDVNFSDGEEKSILDDEIVDNYLEGNLRSGDWATFDSNFAEQVPLESGFCKSEESPSWESDEMATNTLHNVLASEKNPKALKTTKIESQSSQFDFQPLKKQNSRIDDAIEEGGSHLEPLVESTFHRQSSGSSKHSDKFVERVSDYSGGSTGREPRQERTGSGRRIEYPEALEVVRKRDSRSSYSSSGRKYSRGDSDELDEEYHHHRRHHYVTTPSKQPYSERRRHSRHYYDDEGGVENPSFDPNFVPPTSDGSSRGHSRRKHHHREEPDDEENEENDIEDDRSFDSRLSSNASPGSRPRHHHRRRHPPKYYQTHSQSLHRRGRDDRYSPRDRDYSPERYSNHESDFDSYEENSTMSASRRRGGDREYYRDRPDRDPEFSSRPSSSGSGRRNHSGYHHYRGSSRDYYYREPRHGHRHHYSAKERRHQPDDIEHEEISADYSGEEGESKYRRRAGRRPPSHSSHSHHHHHRERPERYSNSASWESESPPHSEKGGQIHRGERKRHSAGKGGRPSSASICPPEPLDKLSYERPSTGNASTRGLYQNEVTLNAKSNNKLNATEFHQIGITPQTQILDQSGAVNPNLSNNQELIIDEPQDFIFEDNFVQPSNSIEEVEKNGNAEGANKTETILVESTSLLQSSEILNTSSSAIDKILEEAEPVFFPSTFDVEMKTTSFESTPEEPQQDTPSEDLGATPKMLTMISEESHNSNSTSNTCPNDVGMSSKDASNAIKKEHEAEMKKSDSFNIFERAKDPFEDDDFFQ